jgi:hypothetical protein
MQKVSVQALNECFNVSGPDYVEMPEDWEKMYNDCTFHLQSKAGQIGGKIGGPKGAKTQIENKIGMYARDKEQLRNDNAKGGKIMGQRHYQNKTGLFGMSEEDKRKAQTNGGKVVGNQRWKCLVTGKITNVGALTRYQRARGIDISLREKVQVN